MLMYSALHIMQWFSGCLGVFTPKIRRKFFDFNIFMNQNKWFGFVLHEAVVMRLYKSHTYTGLCRSYKVESNKWFFISFLFL